MSALRIFMGGLATGSLIVIGEAVLNLGLLTPDWQAHLGHLGLPPPGPNVAAQGLLKLLLLGWLSVALAIKLRPAFATPTHAALAVGGLVWLLVWAWVQWGLLLAGYVTPRIAMWTVGWGAFELPLAVWVGARIAWSARAVRA